MVGLDAVFRCDNNFAGLDISHKIRADNVKRAGFRGKDRCAFELSENKWSNAEGIAGPDQFSRSQRDQRIGAVNLAQRIHEPVHHRAVFAARHQMNDGFGIGCGLEDRAFADKFVPQDMRVGQIAVMRDGDSAARKIGIHRLDVTYIRTAGRRIARVSDRLRTLELLRMRAVFSEDVADKARMSFSDELHAVVSNDAHGLLAAMLQGVQAEDRQRTGISATEDAEDRAFLVKLVGERRAHCLAAPDAVVLAINWSIARRSAAP